MELCLILCEFVDVINKSNKNFEKKKKKSCVITNRLFVHTRIREVFRDIFQVPDEYDGEEGCSLHLSCVGFTKLWDGETLAAWFAREFGLCI